jgi:hypothetical protein
MGRLPDFLIIGAMKAGTTSLYRDLLTNPAVFFPGRPTRDSEHCALRLEPIGERTDA